MLTPLVVLLVTANAIAAGTVLAGLQAALSATDGVASGASTADAAGTAGTGPPPRPNEVDEAA